MSDLKRKLEECTKAAADAEQKIEALKKSRVEAEAEAARLKPLVQLDLLRAQIAEVKGMPGPDAHGRPVRIATLVNYVLHEMGEATELLFSLPIGCYNPGKYPEYYDGSNEPLSAEDAKEGIFVVASWRWGKGSRHFAKIFAGGTVEVVTEQWDHAFNALDDDPETWAALLCRGKPAKATKEDEDEEEEDDEEEEEDEEDD